MDQRSKNLELNYPKLITLTQIHPIGKYCDPWTPHLSNKFTLER